MFEIPTNARSRDAIRSAHAERARLFTAAWDRVFHPFRQRG